MNDVKYRVAFVGAGHISRYHAAALRHVPNARLLGVYDVDRGRAQAAAGEFGTQAFSSLSSVGERGVNVVHVLTPPDTHAELTLRALELGANVLVEKPLATDVEQCRRIAERARERGLHVCVDHSLLFDLPVKRALASIRAGSIGRVLSVDIIRTAEYPPYEGGPLPPQYRTGGYPFRDLGIHQLYLLEALLGPIEDVRAEWRSIGGEPNLFFDEWRAQVACRDGFGHIHISFNAKPIQSFILVQGTKGMLRIEPMSMTCTRRSTTPLPKAVERVVSAYAESAQSMLQVSQGAVAFLRKKIRQYDGVQRLVAEFYRALDNGDPMPVTVEDAAPIVYWVERIAREADADAQVREQLRGRPEGDVPVLVTGAAGALGSEIVERLQAAGEEVRVFVRRRAASEMPKGVQTAIGDLGDPAAVDDAVRGARVVIHAGAATRGGWTEQRTGTVVGTENIIEACLRYGVEQLIYISSLSVVDWAGARSGEPITEASPLEPHAEWRGAYTRAKLEAENLVRRAVAQRGLRAVILRPGQIYGARLPIVNAAVARRLGKAHVVLGDGALRLPLVHIDDVVDAICLAMEKRLTGGQVIQLVDSELPTQNELLAQTFGSQTRTVRIPRWFVYAAGALSELAFGALKRQSPFSRYRLRSALARRTYVSLNATPLLGWVPRRRASSRTVVETVPQQT